MKNVNSSKFSLNVIYKHSMLSTFNVINIQLEIWMNNLHSIDNGLINSHSIENVDKQIYIFYGKYK